MNEDIGQPWSPPQELTLPTPRPVRRVSWLAAARGQGLEFGLVALVPIFALCALVGLPFVLSGDKFDRLPMVIKIVSGAFAFGGFLGVPSSLAVVLFFILPTTYFTLQKVKRLLKWGRPAQAVVTIVFYARPYKGVGGRWFSTLEFQDDSGSKVKGDVKRKLVGGDLCTVLYDPNKPKKFTIYPVAGYEIGGPEGS